MNRKGVPASLFSLDGCCRTCYREDHETAACESFWAERHTCAICLSAVPNGEECPCRAIAREQREREIRERNRKGAERHARSKERARARHIAQEA